MKELDYYLLSLPITTPVDLLAESCPTNTFRAIDSPHRLSVNDRISGLAVA